jgi:hypothetical protein
MLERSGDEGRCASVFSICNALALFLCGLFYIIFCISSDYFPKQKQPVGRCNADCFPCMVGTEFLICIPS